jgi:hypothetical protein
LRPEYAEYPEAVSRAKTKMVDLIVVGPVDIGDVVIVLDTKGWMSTEELRDGGGATTKLLESIVATEIEELPTAGTGIIDGMVCSGGRAVVELLDCGGTTETTEVLIMGEGATATELECGTVTSVAIEARITVPISVLADAGSDC